MTNTTTHYQITLLTMQGTARDIRQPAESREERIARLEEWQRNTGHLSWTAAYKARAAELATLRGGE
jgi:hypothetical protein